jgi:signal transduction histidine kinase
MAAYSRAEGLAPVFRLAIIALLAISIIAAIFLAASLFLVAGSAKRSQYAAIADICGERLRQTGEDDVASAAAVRDLQKRFVLEGLLVVDGARTFAAGEVEPQAGYREERRVAGRRVEIRFTDHEMRRLVRTARIVFAVGGAAMLGGIILVLSIFASAVRAKEAGPVGGSADAAVSGYLIEMHSREKERADALATITETLVRSLASGFISVDEHGMLLDMNSAAREILDIPSTSPVRNRRLEEVLGATEFQRVLAKAIDERASLQRVEIAHVNERIVGLTTVPLLDAGGRGLGMLALFTDLTPVRQLETRLRDMQSLADLGEMSAGIAHEFRNSLSAVLGYLRLAQKSNVPPEAEERIRRAEGEARLLSEAVESLLTFARPMDLQTRPIDVTALLAETAERLRPLSSSIAIEVRGGPLVIDGDAVLLGRAFENLIRNAAEAIQERGSEGTIAIDVTPAQQCIRIADDGVGIDDSEASRLFLPFRSTKPNGFGLGLALTRKIILLHRGTISMTGKRGVGSTVRIDLTPLQ